MEAPATACATRAARRSIPTASPTAWCDDVSPRAAPRRRPSSPTIATSVFEFPPSPARTVLTPPPPLAPSVSESPPSTARTVLTPARPPARTWRRPPEDHRSAAVGPVPSLSSTDGRAGPRHLRGRWYHGSSDAPCH